MARGAGQRETLNEAALSIVCRLLPHTKQNILVSICGSSFAKSDIWIFLNLYQIKIFATSFMQYL